MTPGDKEIIEKWGKEILEDIILKIALTADERSSAFESYGSELTRIVPKLRIQKDEEEDAPAPALRIGQNIRYSALPAENELDPFFTALMGLSDLSDQVPSSLRNQIAKFKVPALFKVYISPNCTFCPKVVTQLLSLAGVNESIQLTIIDGVLFKDLARADQVQSSPTVILDDKFRWTGSIQLAEIVDVISNRDPSKLSALSLKGMLDDGNAAGVAQMMLESEKIFPAFLELLVHEKWPVRLGAMVAFESIVEQNTNLAAEVVTPLLKAFSKAEDTLKGDILYVLGESRDTRVIPKLKAVLTEPHDHEVKAAAVEALEKLEN